MHAGSPPVLLGLTGGADTVSIQDAVTPNGLSCGSVEHGPHHLVKGLVGVTPQCTLGVFIDKAPAESWKDKVLAKCCLLPELVGYYKRLKTDAHPLNAEVKSDLCQARLC